MQCSDCHKKLVLVGVTVTTTSLSGGPQFNEELTMFSSSAMAKMKANGNRALIPSPIHHPAGVTPVEIVGIARGDRGRSCEEHDVCGAVLQEDCAVWIRHVQIIGATGKEKSALVAYSEYWISEGIDCCRVGFLPRHLLKQWQVYDGRIAQVVDIYKGFDSPAKKSNKNVRNSGCCEAVLIDTHRT